MPLIPQRTKIEKIKEDEEPPLCAFVVDDDRYVFPFSFTSSHLHFFTLSIYSTYMMIYIPPFPLVKMLIDSLTRMLMSRMLTRLGHQVTMAENGKIALQMIKDSQEGKPGVPKFDVCFLDK
jgi:CheY-like chemotaxis protein